MQSDADAADADADAAVAAAADPEADHAAAAADEAIAEAVRRARHDDLVVRSLRKFGPDARLVRRAFAKLQAIMGGRQRLLRAVAGFTRRSELRALRAWRFSKRNFQRNGMLLHFSAVSEHAIARTTHPWRVSPAIIIVFRCLLMHVCRHAC